MWAAGCDAAGLLRGEERVRVRVTWARNITWSYDADLPIDYDADFQEDIQGRNVGPWKLIGQERVTKEPPHTPPEL
jgi:hypothetical protein